MRQLIIFGLSIFCTTSFALDSYQIPISTQVRITEHAVCKTVFNDSPTGQALMVPTKTLAEWNAFLSNLPTGVFAGECGMLGGGGSRSDAPGGATTSRGGAGGSGIVIIRYLTP
ncbi:MAG: hypothetical protein U1E10_02150 [Bdellovibrionales bacterium]|nr:hypothetical protein [Bdellovibrionales bacterium]